MERHPGAWSATRAPDGVALAPLWPMPSPILIEFDADLTRAQAGEAIGLRPARRAESVASDMAPCMTAS